MKIDLDDDELATVLHALNSRRHLVEKRMESAKRKGWRLPTGKTDVNSADLARVRHVLRKIHTQTGKQQET